MVWGLRFGEKLTPATKHSQPLYHVGIENLRQRPYTSHTHGVTVVCLARSRPGWLVRSTRPRA